MIDDPDDPDNPDIDHNLDEGYEVVFVGKDEEVLHRWPITTPQSEVAGDDAERRRCRNYVIRFEDGRVYRTGYVYR